MTLVTTPLGEGFTLADWEAMPDDGRRYELIGGTIEIVSPGSRTHDKVTKRAVYAEAGIEHYWLVDGTGARPRFTALRLADGEYDTVLDTGGRVELDTPLCVAFSTPDLFRRPR